MQIFAVFIIIQGYNTEGLNWCRFCISISSCTAELGDYDPRRHTLGYVSEFRLLAHQTPEFEGRAADIHRTLT